MCNTFTESLKLLYISMSLVVYTAFFMSQILIHVVSKSSNMQIYIYVLSYIKLYKIK